MNVPYSKLLNAVTARRAFREFLGALATGGDLALFKARARDKKLSAVEFAPFNMFEGDIHEMFIARPKVDTSAFIDIYEAFADRPLGWVKRPGQVCNGIYKDHAHRQFAGWKHDEQWWGPATTLLAASLWLGTEAAHVRPGDIMVYLGNGYMRVTAEGCYVNGRSAPHPAACPPIDLAWPTTQFPAVKTNNAILRALHEQLGRLPHRASVAGNAVAVALREGLIENKWMIEQVVAHAD